MAFTYNKGDEIGKKRLFAAYEFAGAPVDGTSGTLAAFAKTGELLIDTTTGDWYVNKSVTAGSPAWKLVTTAA